MKRKPEDVAAVVNALVVLFGPPLLMVAGSLLRGDGSSNTSTVVVGVDPSPVSTFIGVFGPMLMALAPFALVAGWRTHVHARRWREGRGKGWAGVAEAAVVAAGVALIVLAPGILTRPLDAPPYVIVYGGGAIVLGLFVGVILRFTALVTLRRFAVAMLFLAGASAGVSAQASRLPVSKEFLLRAGAAGAVEVGQEVDAVYAAFDRHRVQLTANFLEGMFEPMLEIRLAEGDPGPALVTRIREAPCFGFRVWAISVLDRRFRTTDGLGVGSTFGEIRKRYPAVKKVGEKVSESSSSRRRASPS